MGRGSALPSRATLSVLFSSSVGGLPGRRPQACGAGTRWQRPHLWPTQHGRPRAQPLQAPQFPSPVQPARERAGCALLQTPSPRHFLCHLALVTWLSVWLPRALSACERAGPQVPPVTDLTPSPECLHFTGPSGHPDLGGPCCSPPCGRVGVPDHSRDRGTEARDFVGTPRW